MIEPSSPAATSGCWPNGPQETLLRAALLDGDDGRRAWRHWEAQARISPLDGGSLRLLPLLYVNLVRLRVSSPLLPRLKRIHRQAWSRNQQLFDRVANAVASLEIAGVSTLILKGVPLAIEHYDSAAARPMADADVLVHPSDTETAVAVLRDLHWTPLTEPGRWPVEPRASWPIVDAGGQELDLHWRVFSESFVPDDGLWARARPLSIRGTTTKCLAPPEQLLHVLVHGIQWNPVPSIRWVADAVMVLRRAGPAFEWHELLALSERRRFQSILHAGLDYLQRALDVPVPDDVRRRLDGRRTTRRERRALATRVQPGPVAAAHRLWCDYRRFADDRGRRATPFAFVRYLQAFWLVETTGALLRLMTAKSIARWKHARTSTAAGA